MRFLHPGRLCLADQRLAAYLKGDTIALEWLSKDAGC